MSEKYQSSTLKELLENPRVGQNSKSRALKILGEMSAYGITREQSRAKYTGSHMAHVSKIIADIDEKKSQIDQQLAELTSRRNQIASKYNIVTNDNAINHNMTAAVKKVYDISALINCNPSIVGVAVVNNQVLFSNSANNFPLETRWDGKNNLESGGNIVHQGWLLENFTARMNFCTKNSAFKDTDWEFCVQLSAPYTAKVQPDTYGKIVEAPTFGTSSIYGCTMLWLRNKNTGELARLIADETKWLSCSYWLVAFYSGRDCLSRATRNLRTDYDLWETVRRLSESRVKELNARQR